jgi:cation diffusion facilitator CzcD-associated flavoprotein CzcO
MPTPLPEAPPQRVEVAIIGAGFGGLCAAAQLDRAGISDLLLLERGASVGGTWRDNTYPGAACDIPSHLYSLSFQLNPDWTRAYSPQPEIQAYLEDFATQAGLRDRILLGQSVRRVELDEARGHWVLHRQGAPPVHARFVITAVGGLKDPKRPDIPGLDNFAGPVIHSARWRSDLPLQGLRVGVIGTGASAIQLVPELAPITRQLTVFQRTPAWVVPRSDRAYSAVEKAAFRHIPGLMQAHRLRLYLRQELRYPLLFKWPDGVGRLLERLVTLSIRQQVKDPVLAEKLRPNYRMGCKRVLVSNDWYPTLVRPDVTVETRAITRIEAGGAILSDGSALPLDALVLCTGFTVDQPLGDLDVIGLGGRDLKAHWGPRPRAYLGISERGFPNAFMLLGPNTALGHNSVLVMVEAQVNYILQAIGVARALPEDQLLDLKEGETERFIEEVDRRHAGQVWASGCQSWYLGPTGKNFTLWPGSTLDYLRRTRRFDSDRYEVRRVGPR